MNEKDVHLNRPQVDLHTVNANKTYALWGRATGKSNGGLGPRLVHLAEKMPRAQIGFTAPSYKMAFGQILPNVLGFLQNEMFMKEGENYVIGKKPPDDWPQPLIPIFDHKYVISMDNGCAVPILSLEAQGTGNGFNLQANLGDEAKFFDEKKLKAEVIRAIRGGKKQFGHLPEFQSQWYFTDKYEGNIEWMLDKKKLMNPDVIKAVIRMQLEVNELMQNPEGNADAIARYTTLLTRVRKGLVYVSEASAEDNREILGDEFFINQKADATPLEYDVAIRNMTPNRVENTFYPSLHDGNLYQNNHDVDPSAPLIIALDYQWRISPIVVAQIAQLPGSDELSLNLVRDFYTLHPQGIREAIDKFCHHFMSHPTRTIYYLFDKTATNRSSTAEPAYEIVINRLQSYGWDVIAEHMGEPPLHSEKFKTINEQLAGKPHTLAVRINEVNAADMLNSVRFSPARTISGRTAKNKDNEKNMSFPAERSTHFSDVFDMILYGVLDLELVPHRYEQSGFGIVIR